MQKHSDTAIRFSLFTLLAVISYLALASAIVSYTRSITWGVHAILGLIGWILWRNLRKHLASIIFVLLGADGLLCSSVRWLYYGTEDFLGLRLLLDGGMSSELGFFFAICATFYRRRRCCPSDECMFQLI